MTNEQINIAIAETCGWTDCVFVESLKLTKGFPPPNNPTIYGTYENGMAQLPNYCNDLNVMHEAERTSTIFKSWRATKTWMDNLCICSDLGRLPESAPDWAFVLQATAAQRAEAFLKTIGEWEE